MQIKIWHHNLLCLVQMLVPGYQLVRNFIIFRFHSLEERLESGTVTVGLIMIIIIHYTIVIPSPQQPLLTEIFFILNIHIYLLLCYICYISMES